ncbi:MAG: Flp pilus assembly complex ATPase component TadA [Candidatus Omnitrophica bacterium]|nr:Flp pilus assembly complex ATPase component TadA [Candidatus Omnitrophota bacterium]
MISLKERLTELLITNKLMTEEQLKDALRVQKEKGGKLSAIIVNLNFIKESDLISILSQGLGLPLIDLKRFKIEKDIVNIIPVDIARYYQIIPVSKMGDTVTLAMADPLNIFATDHVSALTGLKINPIISSSQDILQAIELYYPDTTRDAINNLTKEMEASSIELIKETNEVLPSGQELSAISLQAPVVKVTDMLIEEAVGKKASDILIEPLDKKLRVRLRIDGVLHESRSPSKSMHASIISRIKVISDLDIAEHRLPQDGRFKARILGKEIDFRVSVIPSSMGEKVAIRILDKSSVTLDIEKLGFSRDAVENLKSVTQLPHGMILSCGPTGSGKTTTLYSILKFIDSPQKNIVTVEDPVEFQLAGINQVSARPEIGLTFAGSLRSILRQDPNVIMIGEIRDFDTVDIAIKSALTGHLVLSTLHTTTSSGAIVRLVNMGIEPYLINASLICVIAQRLVRKICEHCKEEYAVKNEILQKLQLGGHPDKKIKFYRGKGCEHCYQMGYSGRAGLVEILMLSSRIRELILSRVQEHILKAEAVKEGMKTLRQEGLNLALQGVTTLEEILRITPADE